MNDEQLIWESYTRITESTESALVYHGGDWKGETVPFVRRGSFGVGTYFTPHKEAAYERAKEYGGKYVVTCKFINNNFVRIEEPPIVYNQLDIFLKMGHPKDEKSIDKLDKTINRIMDQHGYMGAEYRKYSEKHNLGYQGVVWYDNEGVRSGVPHEYCSWYPHNVKVISVDNV